MLVFGVSMVPAAIGAKSPPPRVPAAFTQCAACHSVKPGVTGVGPSLSRIVGRKAGTQANFKYSPALKQSGVVWTRQELTRYLDNPSARVAGTTMPDPGLTSAELAQVVTYLLAAK